MCRHLAYLGPRRQVADILTAGTHSLYRQSWAPRDMRGGGTINADGFGAAWWNAAGRATVYRRATPIWGDQAVTGVLTEIASGAVLAAIRSATVGMPLSDSACAPFSDGRWAFSHNGVVHGWPESMVPLARNLETAELLTLDAPTDSAVLWALVRDRLRRAAAPADALAAVVTEVAAAAPGSRLNCLLSDGVTVVASAWDHALSMRVSDAEVWIASEPIDDDPGWNAIPDRSLVVAGAEGAEVIPLEPALSRLDPQRMPTPAEGAR